MHPILCPHTITLIYLFVGGVIGTIGFVRSLRATRTNVRRPANGDIPPAPERGSVDV